MKKNQRQHLLLICGILALITVLVPLSNAQVATQPHTKQNPITITYTFSSPTFTTQNQRTQISLPHVTTWGIAGEPVIPVHQARILLPPQTTVESIEILTTTPQTYSISSLVTNGQEPIPLNTDEPPRETPPKTSVYSSQDPYPGVLYKNTGIQHFRGYRILFLALYPVQYKPAPGIITFYPEITLQITTAEDTTTPDGSLLREKPCDADDVEQKIDNPEAIPLYESELSASSTARNYQLLIITNEILKPGFIKLAQAHNARGIPTVIKTIGHDIPQSPSYNQTCENIRNYIRRAYTNNKIDYVLLGGDVDIIPAPYLWSSDYIPSDLYYGCLDGPYNGDGDEKWGEPNDGINGGDVDLVAEVYVGRASAGNLTEVGVFVNKTLWYMTYQSPPQEDDQDNDYMKNILMVGEFLNPGYGDDYMDQIIPYIPASEYNISTLYDRDWPGYWPVTELANRINNGTHIVNHLGHSGPFYNMRFDLRFHDLDLLTNDDKLCFIYSQGCDAGALDRNASDDPHDPIPDCIAEHFTVKISDGPFAGIWNTRYGYASDSTEYHKQFYDAIFNEGMSVFSVANQDSREDNIHLLPGDNIMRWCYYELMLFGDPTLSLYNSPLHADSNGPYIHYVNRPIQFRGMAYGGTPPYQYFWDFGDGNISRLKNPRHTYLRSGDYTVTLVVTDHTGQTNTSITTTSIEVGVQAFGPSLGLLNETIKFSGSAFAGFPPYTWEWNFGDGNVSHSQNTLHNYSRARIYNVTLTVTDSQQNKGNTTIYIRIASPFVYVDDDAPLGGDGSHAHPFNNITLALIEVADPGTVYVNNGTYVEFLYINKSVTLRAESREHTILDGFENPDSILVNHNNVTIQNFTIFNTSTGISIIDSSNIKISDNILTHTYTGYGIQTYNVTKCTITHNTLSSYFYGILIQSSSDISVEDNVLSSHRYAGIQLQDTTTISILRNTITESGQYGISLIIDFGETHHNIVKENIISGCYWKGIILTGSHNNTISNNICFSNSENDIVLEESSNNIVQNNVCSYTNCGIYLTFLSNENIIENNICRSNINYGLYIQNSYYNTIQNNVFENCSLFLDGNQETFTYQEISGNTVNDKPIYYYKNSNLDNASAPDDAGEIILVNCSWFTIEHTLFTHTNTAVLIAYSSHITLNDNMFLRQNSFHLYLLSAHNISMTNNTFSVSGWIGMRFYSSSYLTFSRNRINLTWTGIEASACSHSSFMDNVFENMNQGIGLDSSHDCIIANNSISGIPETDYVFGLYISYSHDNCISSNTIVGNAYGIAFWNSSRNICEKNVITNNRYSGISFKCFWGSCEDNVLRENTIAFNNHGIKIDPNTVNTLIYHNNFINNTVNAYDTCSNSWNHSSLFGNYWSDYNGTDGNGDGIGDIAYDIPPEGLNKDYAPFMVRDGWLLR